MTCKLRHSMCLRHRVSWFCMVTHSCDSTEIPHNATHSTCLWNRKSVCRVCHAECVALCGISVESQEYVQSVWHCVEFGCSTLLRSSAQHRKISTHSAHTVAHTVPHNMHTLLRTLLRITVAGHIPSSISKIEYEKLKTMPFDSRFATDLTATIHVCMGWQQENHHQVYSSVITFRDLLQLGRCVCVCVCTYTHIRTCVNRFRHLLQAAKADVYVRTCVCICLYKRGGACLRVCTYT